MTAALWGAATVASWAVAVFFARYYRHTRDRLFLLFAIGFALLSLSWIGQVIGPTLDERHHYIVFVPRLVAFVLIAVAVIDKNRSSR
jgi:hypothetical protein